MCSKYLPRFPREEAAFCPLLRMWVLRLIRFCDNRREDGWNASPRMDLNAKPLKQSALGNKTNQLGLFHHSALFLFFLNPSPGAPKMSACLKQLTGEPHSFCCLSFYPFLFFPDSLQSLWVLWRQGSCLTHLHVHSDWHRFVKISFNYRINTWAHSPLKTLNITDKAEVSFDPPNSVSFISLQRSPPLWMRHVWFSRKSFTYVVLLRVF